MDKNDFMNFRLRFQPMWEFLKRRRLPWIQMR